MSPSTWGFILKHASWGRIDCVYLVDSHCNPESSRDYVNWRFWLNSNVRLRLIVVPVFISISANEIQFHFNLDCLTHQFGCHSICDYRRVLQSTNRERGTIKFSLLRYSAVDKRQGRHRGNVIKGMHEAKTRMPWKSDFLNMKLECQQFFIDNLSSSELHGQYVTAFVIVIPINSTGFFTTTSVVSLRAKIYRKEIITISLFVAMSAWDIKKQIKRWIGKFPRRGVETHIGGCEKMWGYWEQFSLSLMLKWREKTEHFLYRIKKHFKCDLKRISTSFWVDFRPASKRKETSFNNSASRGRDEFRGSKSSLCAYDGKRYFTNEQNFLSYLGSLYLIQWFKLKILK